ncbi:Homocysteine-responsive endoplasmic reticulum-resident ubiquitin-like domain member 2 protein [Liparis tanakae]|uniref:Homocysteine-responsive endoplasmic reticulum-resident ubiquitin-like domain member 2 protein n=1 Tax=Liparis tanakae TaxID=230148 RepID=A0A4Z2H302_9TELE|nr:Homocysteine-responsive endoplasmic reticulum-resident ubiquitin-like domain member 2 protein [Liparis tanakae]
MDQGVVDSHVILVIRAPNQKYNDHTINCCHTWTVEKLKAHISDVYPSKPLLAASSQHGGSDQSSTSSDQPDPLSQRPQAERRGNPEVQMNAQGGEMVNEEELNRDWLDWVYTFSRAAILLSIVYFYSSFSRFVMVMMAMLVLYLHQAGWFPFNLENELQLPGDGANQEEAEAELQNQDAQEMEGATDDGSEDDGESGEEGAEDPNSAPEAGFLSSTWSFIITFFMSLIPEGPANAAN